MREDFDEELDAGVEESEEFDDEDSEYSAAELGIMKGAEEEAEDPYAEKVTEEAED